MQGKGGGCVCLYKLSAAKAASNPRNAAKRPAALWWCSGETADSSQAAAVPGRSQTFALLKCDPNLKKTNFCDFPVWFC